MPGSSSSDTTAVNTVDQEISELHHVDRLGKKVNCEKLFQAQNLKVDDVSCDPGVSSRFSTLPPSTGQAEHSKAPAFFILPKQKQQNEQCFCNVCRNSQFNSYTKPSSVSFEQSQSNIATSFPVPLDELPSLGVEHTPTSVIVSISSSLYRTATVNRLENNLDQLTPRWPVGRRPRSITYGGEFIPKSPKFRPTSTSTIPTRWCSVDLRDGNQALINPMTVEQKLKYFYTLVQMGMKEIEIGFPAASQLDFDFTRLLIEKKDLPEDVWLMVLVQAREHLIRRTIEALHGVKNVIIHLYNSTSELQRRVVFQLPPTEIKQLAVNGTTIIRQLVSSELKGSRVRFEYSPESFTQTELAFALEICLAVMDVWKPSSDDPIILNLPETVQSSPPNFYADQIEWMHTHLAERRNQVCISLHPHNDRGTGVAAAELALLAGADRVEGCLFGNGERTGNVCLITLAVNLLHLGIDPELDMSQLPMIMSMYEQCTGMSIHPRHPWAGALVYTAFSGSHQDAIKKGIDAMKKKQDRAITADATDSSDKQQVSNASIWEVPYLPIDPCDLGRSYEATVRINSQSGKGGVAFVMEHEFGIRLPRELQLELSNYVQLVCDETAKEVLPDQVNDIFYKNFMNVTKRIALLTFKLQENLMLEKCVEATHDGLCQMETEESSSESMMEFQKTSENRKEVVQFEGKISLSLNKSLKKESESVEISGIGNGPIHAFINALNKFRSERMENVLDVLDYSEEGIGSGSEAEAVCFVKVKTHTACKGVWGVARHTNTITASFYAIINAINRT